MTGRDDCATCNETTLHELVVLEPEPNTICWEWRCATCNTPNPNVRDRVNIWLQLSGITPTWKRA
jgi:hypothetical protein